VELFCPSITLTLSTSSYKRTSLDIRVIRFRRMNAMENGELLLEAYWSFL
jgi:hypothetical protein